MGPEPTLFYTIDCLIPNVRHYVNMSEWKKELPCNCGINRPLSPPNSRCRHLHDFRDPGFQILEDLFHSKSMSFKRHEGFQDLKPDFFSNPSVFIIRPIELVCIFRIKNTASTGSKQFFRFRQ
jgi:hypothetical protein